MSRPESFLGAPRLTSQEDVAVHRQTGLRETADLHLGTPESPVHNSWGFSSLWPGSRPAGGSAKPIRLYDRIFACVYEDDGTAWEQGLNGKPSPRFLKYLATCGASLKEDWHELTPLHINLGPQWSKQVHDDLKRNNSSAGIVEPSHTGWERPPGLGTFALENMFHLCLIIRSWLHSEDLHSVVLHVHGFSGAGLQCAYLLTSCYLLYVRDFDLYDKAYDALPSASHQLISGPNRQAMQRRPTPAQLQYGRYFRTVLYTGVLQRQHRSEVTLDRVFLLNIEQLLLHLPVTALPSNTGSPRSPTKPHSLEASTDIKLFMCVYSASEIVWSGNPEEGSESTSFKVNKPVHGDVTIGIWLGNHKRDRDAPALAYQFHTALVDTMDQHVPARKITFPEGSPLHEGAARQEQVAMELVLSIRNLTPAEQKAKLSSEASCLQQLQEDWRSLTDGIEPVRSGMSAVVAEMNVAHAAHLKPSDLSSPALAGADSSLLPDTALAAASLLQAPPASDPSTSDATAAEPALLPNSPVQAVKEPPAPPSLPSSRPPPPPPPPPGANRAAPAGFKGPPPPPPPPGSRVPPPPAPPHGGKGPPPPPSPPGAKGPTPPPPPGGKGPPPPPPPAGKGPPPLPGKGLLKGGLGTKAVYGQPRFRVLHWVKAPKGSGTVWCDVPDPLPDLPAPQHHALEKLFGVKAAASKPATGAKAPKKLAEVVKVIDLPRANNVSIMLTQFTSFKGGALQLRHAVLTGAKLGLERLSLLLQIAPTDEEVNKLKGYLEQPGRVLADLSTPEQFMHVIGQVPRLRAKTACLLFREQFETLVKDTRSALEVITTAVQQVRQGPKLRSVIQAVLTVGNAVNIGTAYGNAQGIKLDSLLKFADVKVVTAATAMQPKSEHSAGEVKAAAGESASKTHATAPAAPGLPREAPVIGVRTLLEFVAWTVSTNAQDSSSKPIKGKTGDQLAGRKGAVFLTEELSAVGVAVRRMQGDMTEAMKTLDAGMAAAVLEVRASSKALPVTAPACNPDGASAEVKQDAPASSPSDVAIASIGRSDPVSHGDSGSGRIDQAAASIGQSSDTSRSGMPEAGQSTGPGQNTRGALGASAMANASARNVSQGVSRGALDAAVPGRTPTSDTSTSSIALQLSAADPADNSPSNHAYSASDSATSPVGLRSSEQTGLASVLKKPGNDSMQAAHTVTLHVDASSSTATQQRSAHGQNAAQSRSEAQGSDATTASSLIGQEAGQLTAMSQSSQSSDPSQPAAAILQHPVVAGMSQAGAASSTADQGELIVDGLSPVKAVATQAASADAGLPDHIPTACAVAVTTAAGKTPAAMQQPLEGSPAVVVKPVPAWFAEEGHFALMLQDFTVTAQQQKQDLHITVAETEQQIAGLRKWLCEPVDSDPAAMLATIWNFANSFDQAYRNVQRLLQ